MESFFQSEFSNGYLKIPIEKIDSTIMLDTFKIANRIYYNVLPLKFSLKEDDIIQPDSLYYSFEKGIIKIRLNNEETYTIEE